MLFLIVLDWECTSFGQEYVKVLALKRFKDLVFVCVFLENLGLETSHTQSGYYIVHKNIKLGAKELVIIWEVIAKPKTHNIAIP